MSVRRSVSVVALALALGSSALVASGASAQAPAPWSPPKHIPDTAGLANPISAMAPDGTDLVARLVVGTGAFANAVKGQVRLPGETKWRRVPKGPNGTFLGVTDIAPTTAGDFWMTYVTGSGDYRSYVVKLDSHTQRWSKPVRLFKDQKNYYHGSPELELAADGTLVVTAYAPPKVDPPGDPVARLVVGRHSRGGTWKNRFLSPADKFASGAHIAGNRAGDVVISFIQGYNLGDMRVRAVSRAHGKHSAWKVSSLSVAGDSQRAHPAIGAEGTAAVVWSAPSTGTNAIRMATRKVRRDTAPWVGRNVVTGTSVDVDAHGVVNRKGETTAVWRQSGGGTTALWSRHLDSTGWGAPVQLTPNGEIAEFDALIQRPDGKAGLLYQRFTPTIDGLAVEFRTLKDGQPGVVQQLIGDEATDGASNSEFLGIDAASRGTMIYTRGDFPDTDFAWLSQSKRPSVMTGSATGKAVERARVKGSLRIGTRATCASGYWVETSSFSYRWKRNGHRIAGATSKRYRLVDRDDNERISCRVKGFDDVGHHLALTSPSERAG